MYREAMFTPGTRRIRCAGSGTSVPMRKAHTTCVVLIPIDKPSGLCNFCERTEAQR